VRRGGHAITGLHDSSRDVIAVTNATLHRIGRRETLAGLVEDFASEKSPGAQSSGAGDPLRPEARLDLVKRSSIDDGRVQAGPGSTVVIDLAEIAGRSLQTVLQPRLLPPGLPAADPRDAFRRS
jgi:hypothetical protein